MKRASNDTCISISFDFFIQFNVPFKDYFSSYETGQTVVGVKTEPQEKNTRHSCKKNLACLTCALCWAQTHTRYSGEMIKRLSTVMKYQHS